MWTLDCITLLLKRLQARIRFSFSNSARNGGMLTGVRHMGDQLPEEEIFFHIGASSQSRAGILLHAWYSSIAWS